MHLLIIPWDVNPEIFRIGSRSEEHTSELQSRLHIVCRLLLEKKTNVDTNTNMGDVADPRPRDPGSESGRVSARCKDRPRIPPRCPQRLRVHILFFFKCPGAPRILPLSLPGPLPN